MLKWGIDLGVYCVYAGFVGLAVSGFVMTLAYGVPS